MFEINLSEPETNNLDEFIKVISSEKEITIKFITSVGFSGSHLPIAEDFLEIWYISERLAKNCHVKNLKQSYENYRLVIRFSAFPKSIPLFVDEIKYLCEIHKDDVLEDSYTDYWEEIYAFLDESERLNTNFPELGDSYWANFIGGFYDLDRESLKELLGDHPEFFYNFWRSCYSNNLGFSFFTSTDCAIVSIENDPIHVIKEFFGVNQSSLQFSEIFLIQINREYYCCFENNLIVQIPFDIFMHAKVCAGIVFSSQENVNYIDYQIDEISYIEQADIIIIRSSDTFIIIPNCKRVTESEVSTLIANLGNSSEYLLKHSNIPLVIKCPWQDINDEDFEQLCYDIIAESGKFEVDSLQKMGKSRSRDGGRDIQAYSKTFLGSTPKKWIIQCKKIGTDSSLSASKLNISDTIDQYGAEGYCVMTSGIVDSTLYDRLEGISKTRQKEYKVWSILEIERFLASHSNIRSRYFPPNKS